MSELYLETMSFALGEEAKSLEESVAAGRTLSPASAFRDAGFGQHWLADPQTSAFDLALRACRQLETDWQSIDALIYATCLTLNGNLGTWQDFERTRDVKHLLDYPASHLQAALEIPQASVIGLNQQACTSVLGSIRLARGLLLAEPEIRRILCVSADRFPEAAIYEQAYNLISDGASAFTLSREPRGYRVLSCAALTNGALAQANDDETVGSYFSFTCKVIKDALRHARIQAQDITWVVPQNTNLKAWQILSRVLGIAFERVYAKTLAEFGHIISSDNIVNLMDLEQKQVLQSGDKLLLCMAGYGLNWQAVVLEKV